MMKKIKMLKMVVVLVTLVFGMGIGHALAETPKKSNDVSPYGRYAATYGLSEEQAQQLAEQQKLFFEATDDLSQDIYATRLALRAELAKRNPDESKALEQQRRLTELLGRLGQERIKYALKIKKIVPNESHRFCGMGYGNMMGRSMMGGYGYGPMGYGMMGSGMMGNMMGSGMMGGNGYGPMGYGMSGYGSRGYGMMGYGNMMGPGMMGPMGYGQRGYGMMGYGPMGSYYGTPQGGYNTPMTGNQGSQSSGQDSGTSGRQGMMGSGGMMGGSSN